MWKLHYEGPDSLFRRHEWTSSADDAHKQKNNHTRGALKGKYCAVEALLSYGSVSAPNTVACFAPGLGAQGRDPLNNTSGEQVPIVKDIEHVPFIKCALFFFYSFPRISNEKDCSALVFFLSPKRTR